MDLWDVDAIGLVGPAFIEFEAGGGGQFRFIAVDAVRYERCRVEEDGGAATSRDALQRQADQVPERAARQEVLRRADYDQTPLGVGEADHRVGELARTDRALLRSNHWSSCRRRSAGTRRSSGRSCRWWIVVTPSSVAMPRPHALLIKLTSSDQAREWSEPTARRGWDRPGEG